MPNPDCPICRTLAILYPTSYTITISVNAGPTSRLVCSCTVPCGNLACPRNIKITKITENQNYCVTSP